VAQPVATQANTARNSDESLIAREDTFEGQLNTTRGVRVMGTVRGGIESQQYVHIEENAHVEADITAQEVVIAGEYSGKLTCRQRVEIRATGRVSGEIETQKLLLHEGGYFDGELHMQKPAAAPAAAANTTSNKSENKDQPRRTRYVDLSSDSTSTREVGATENGTS
jgi:cytoskeletal protein CcmA (bactofilin family)